MPLVNCFVTDALVRCVPNVQQMLLQVVDIVQLQLIDLLLDDTAYHVVDRIEV